MFPIVRFIVNYLKNICSTFVQIACKILCAQRRGERYGAQIITIIIINVLLDKKPKKITIDNLPQNGKNQLFIIVVLINTRYNDTGVATAV